MIINAVKTYFTARSDYGMPRKREAFWASDVEKNGFDLYHEWKGTGFLNPVDPFREMIMRSGKAIEMEYVSILTEAGLAVPTDPEKGQDRVSIEREGVSVVGRLDAMVKYGSNLIPAEFKSFYGDYQERELLSGKPKTSYLKQLAIYMDAKDVDMGILIYIHRGTGEPFEFYLNRDRSNKERFFMENGIEFNLYDEYRRWNNLYYNHITLNVEPKSDYVYKYPLDEIDWSKVSKTDISKARTGKKVLGDWQVLYSPYKELIIEREGTTLGYTLEEQQKLMELTKGYSTR